MNKSTSPSIHSRFFVSDDGLELHYLDIASAADSGATPVVCLPGLTRGARDFETLARFLASTARTKRRVLAFDYRGRGRSAHDPDWHRYDLPTERRDVLKGLAHAGVRRAHFVGTSRGGLHVMAMAPEHRALMQSVVLNDIGPKLEIEGLARIKGYVGNKVAPRSFDEAIKLLKIGGGLHFDGLSPEEWLVFAKTTFGDDERDLHFRYDPQLARTLDGFDLSKPLPESWDLFDQLSGVPILTIRGANSDLFSSETLAKMADRWAGSESFTVPGQGHAPLLADLPSMGRIAAFLDQADSDGSR